MAVTDTDPAPSGHVSLYDGTTTVNFVLVGRDGNIDPQALQRRAQNRTSLKGSEGGSTYSDFEPPYIPVVQNDWSGGRGQEDFERDRSRYFDNYRTNTWISNQILLGPQEQYTTGFRSANQSLPGDLAWQQLTGSQQFYAVKFTAPAAGYSAGRVQLWIRYLGTPNANLVVALRNTSSGDPTGSVIFSDGLAASSFLRGNEATSAGVSQFFEFGEAAGTYSLTGSTDYWVRLEGHASDDDNNHWAVGVSKDSGTTEQSSDGSSWSAATKDIYYRVVDAEDERESLFFEYKRGLYAVTKPDDTSAGQLYLNGDRGTADDNSGDLTNLEDASQSWTADEWIGAIVYITAGPGSEEPQPWRNITDNDTDSLVCDRDWFTTHTTATEYVILGSDTWQEITTTGITGPVTDVLVSKDVIYFAQGDSINIRRANFATSGGTWTLSYADDSTNKGTFLELVEDPIDGQQVWVADNSATTVARANAQVWGTDLTLRTGIVVGSTNVRITGLDKYDDPEVLWVLKEDSQWSVENDIPDQIPLREMASVASPKNGKAHLVHGVYLYFSLLHSLERYFQNNLDDVGPSQDYGLPQDRQGPIVDMVGYPGRFFAAIDGGTGPITGFILEGNYSSILTSTGTRDWHEVYRSNRAGRRIRNLYFQVVPGTLIDRLWFTQGMDLMYLHFPSETFDPLRDANYRFTHEGHMITSWMYADMQDVQKFFKSVKIFAEQLNSSSKGRVVECEYQTDTNTENSTWNAVNGTFDTNPVEEIDLVSNSVANAVTGRRVRFRFRLTTNVPSGTPTFYSPRVKATVIEMLGKVAQKYRYSFGFQVHDFEKDLLGIRSGDRAQTKVTQLETWATNPTPLTFRDLRSPFDNKTVMLTSLELDPLEVDPKGQLEKLTGSLTVVEI